MSDLAHDYNRDHPRRPGDCIDLRRVDGFRPYCLNVDCEWSGINFDPEDVCSKCRRYKAEGN